MAPSPAAGLPPARPSSSHLWRAGGVLPPVSGSHVLLQGPRRRHRRPPGGVVRAAPDAPPVVRAAVSAVTELLRAIAPNKTPRQASPLVRQAHPWLWIWIPWNQASIFLGSAGAGTLPSRVRSRTRRRAAASRMCSPCSETTTDAPTSSPVRVFSCTLLRSFTRDLLG